MTMVHPARNTTSTAALVDVMDLQGVQMAFARDEAIYAQGDEVEFLYRLLSGSVRTTRLTSEGRRQIADFYHAGDLFGLEVGPDHRFSAEALSNCIVRVLLRATARAPASDARLDRAILEATRRELDRTQTHLLLLGRRNAREKVAGFLLSLARRAPGADVLLQMGRQDMADYLGITIETVSRTLTQFQGASVVEFVALRTFRVRKWQVLEQLAE